MSACLFILSSGKKGKLDSKGLIYLMQKREEFERKEGDLPVETKRKGFWKRRRLYKSPHYNG
jgi:hypothetical protein